LARGYEDRFCALFWRKRRRFHCGVQQGDPAPGDRPLRSPQIRPGSCQNLPV